MEKVGKIGWVTWAHFNGSFCYVVIYDWRWRYSSVFIGPVMFAYRGIHISSMILESYDTFMMRVYRRNSLYYVF